MEVIQVIEEVMLDLSSENPHAFSTIEYNIKLQWHCDLCHCSTIIHRDINQLQTSYYALLVSCPVERQWLSGV